MDFRELASARALYSRRAVGYDGENARRGEAARVLFAEIAAEIVRVMPVAGDTIDLGAGTGRFAEILGQRSAMLTSVDCSKDMLRVLMRRIQSAPVFASRVVCADVENMPFSDEGFDYAVCISVLQYLDLRAFAYECARILAVGSRITIGVVVVHQDDDSRWRDAEFQSDCEGRYYSRFRTEQDIDNAFHEQGLELISKIECPYRRNFSDLVSDKVRFTAREDLLAACEKYRSASDEVRQIYEIDDLGFTQHYRVFTFERTSNPS
ncbi:class I SAM-dependent methyltransferase [Tsukamurella pseudospumae]|uniref:class I SAM-dependent methyltransferase n=1 Tax=Tsukamurella pseudospumae TaxID=239498 RepID=UPI000AB06616|nr:class I SAM-dependent methyltransferase [Tsukamurella pseudospumae]